MFSEIAARYDQANRILSFGLDCSWRKRLIKTSVLQSGERLLDLCTGTADLVLEFARHSKNAEILGLDLSLEMLQVGQKRLEEAFKSKEVLLIHGDALQLPFSPQSLDVITMAFGLRNLTSAQKGLSEMARVLRPGGRLLILEFSLPKSWVWRIFYLFYLKNILPCWGGWITGSRMAYQYLHDSICAFPPPIEILAQMNWAGFERTSSTNLFGGVATLYRGERPGPSNV
ncbi:bifunctional demethylmenaquinone methyltransferase/2-methoxy-6-polyprenyl-1,4-benzoquinol methylase UbiE [Candidatus Acetothermia bacterium]|nr:bifunctional demethylmenaquinone methyltransferase/2-methoxy-6-polyprenyl-1,4-benzoquinol methylase UbiE [Candidatus Acetothermia bacterium]MBI3643487.1 bifunctional demethylmenaquinone methyltransferase/2-methoxy-6-polyprenyl-1,4-benzoquinol methylase UbiE [Candidatus Acetothermia bacterium]